MVKGCIQLYTPKKKGAYYSKQAKELMADKKKRECTPKQDKFADLVASGKSQQDAILQAGYKTTNPRVRGAQEIRKAWVVDRVNWYCKHKYDKPDVITEPEVEELMTDRELELVMCKGARKDPYVAARLSEMRMKREAQGLSDDLRPVLFSAFLSDDELAEYTTQLPADIVVSIGAGEPEKSEGVANE